MARIGFFEALVRDDISLRERNAINAAHDGADAAIAQGEMLGATIGAMQRVIKAQADEIKKLQTALAVLAHVLEDAGVVDAKVLDYRIEAALDEEDEATTNQVELVMCAGCRQQVPKSRTNITAQGLMCDRCAASR